MRTAYGLRLKLTNENPHKKMVSPAELTALSPSVSSWILWFFSYSRATREVSLSLGPPAREDSDLGSLSRESPGQTRQTRHT